MRSTVVATVAFVATSFSFAAEITLPLTPRSLPSWTLAGAEVTTNSFDPFVLPSGAQLARSFSAEGVAVVAHSEPVFALDPGQWQVIELGDAAVVLAREGNTGMLALTSGREVLLHPHVIPLLADGKASQPLELTLYKGGGHASLRAGGLRVDLKMPLSDPSDVVLSAGDGQPWAITRLEVVLHLAGKDIPEQYASEVAANLAAEAEVDGSGNKRTRSNGLDGESSEAALSLAKLAKEVAEYRPLEVYTPPIVRSNRVDQIKAVLQALRKN